MFKLEITKPSGTISKVYQNRLDEDWLRFVLDNHKVSKENIKIYWIRNLNKNNYDRKKIDLSEAGKVSKGEKLMYKLTGSNIPKDHYDNLIAKLGSGGKIDAVEFKSNKKMKSKFNSNEVVEALDLSIFNKEWFLKESEYQLVELRFPYDENMKFIGFNFDPNA